MNKAITISILTAVGLLAIGQLTYGDDDGDEDGRGKMFERTSTIAPATDPRYLEECGGCHMAYPPGLLPARAWEKIMSDLANHYGDNAELEAGLRASLTEYLVAHSADRSNDRHARKIMRSLGDNQVPNRILDVPYIRHEHKELPAALVNDNPAVKSWSNCQACHRKAEQGSFSERELDIPGYGRWED